MRTFRLAGFLFLVLGGRLFRSLARVNFGDEGDRISLGRPDRPCDVDRQLGQLPGLAAVDRQEPHLGRAASFRDEGDRLAVGAKARVIVGTGCRRQLLRLSTARWHEPETGRGLVGGAVDLGDDVDNQRPIRRKLGIGDPLDGQQVVDGHGPAGGPEGRGRQQDENECEKQSHDVVPDDEEVRGFS